MNNPQCASQAGFSLRRSAVVTLVSAVSLFAATAGRAHAGPSTLEYQVDDIGGGLFDYQFRLVLDNNDGSFVPGQGWDWIIFGDQFAAPTNLVGFIGDPADLPIGPFTHYDFSGGGHNGPTLIQGRTNGGWFPHSVGDELSWSGTATVDLAQGSLLWSTLRPQSGARLVDFEEAMRVEFSDPPEGSPVPEPASGLMLGIGALGMGWMVRRRRVVV